MSKNFLYRPDAWVPTFRMTDIPIIKTPTNPMSSVSMRLNQRCDSKQPSLKGQSCLGMIYFDIWVLHREQFPLANLPETSELIITWVHLHFTQYASIID